MGCIKAAPTYQRPMGQDQIGSCPYKGSFIMSGEQNAWMNDVLLFVFDKTFFGSKY
jgi:hypothetical protein